MIALAMKSRLMKPAPKVSGRLLRDAITSHARKEKLSFVDLEQKYHNTRSALIHLLAGEHYKDGLEDIQKKLENLVAESKKLLFETDAAEVYGRKWADRLLRSVTKLDQASQELLIESRIEKCDIELFIDTLGYIEQAHLDEGYDPSGIVPPAIRTLAGMITANFSAYDMTLNS